MIMLLLIDVFEKFVNGFDGLDPCRYFTSPGLSWNTILKKSGIELKLISDSNMYYFFEERMRGGISYIAKRYSKVKIKYMSDCVSSEKSKFFIHLDAKNLYGWAMSQYLPYGGFKWLNQNEIDKFDVSSIEENSSNAYLLKADLEYPNELYDFHNDYLLAPEKLKTTNGMLSTYCGDIAKKYRIKVDGVNKLVPNLDNKYINSKYIVHYRNLQFY